MITCLRSRLHSYQKLPSRSRWGPVQAAAEKAAAEKVAAEKVEAEKVAAAQPVSSVRSAPSPS